MLMLEDAGHYLFFSIMAITSVVPPALPTVVPCVIFAFFRFSMYLRELLHVFLPDTNPITTALVKLDAHSSAAYGVAANPEIFGFVRVIIVALMCARECALFHPLTRPRERSLLHLVAVFAYMQFLQLRYVSRRNRYSREAWAKLSAAVSASSAAALCRCSTVAASIAHHPRCPGIVASLLSKAQLFLSNIGAQMLAAAEQSVRPAPVPPQ